MNAIANTVYALVGVPKGSPLPAHSHGYPVAYLTLYGKVVCSECATNHDDEMNPVTDGGIIWEGPTYNCDTCGCEISSAYGPKERNKR